jgi:hypothetical protein
MAAILTRAYNFNGAVKTEFKDVPLNHWAYADISTLAANKIPTEITTF